jgi:hypothetical protein
MTGASGSCGARCWVNGTMVISWPSVTDPTDWDIGWRAPSA